MHKCKHKKKDLEKWLLLLGVRRQEEKIMNLGNADIIARRKQTASTLARADFCLVLHLH